MGTVMIEEISELVMKHDGYLYGQFSDTVKCRFVSRSLFEPAQLPTHFLIDLNQKYRIKNIRGHTITVAGPDGEPWSFEARVHCPTDELKYMDDTDFTCNLLDYRRDGSYIHSVPDAVAYEVSPYETVKEHVKKKHLVPVKYSKAIETVEAFVNAGWSNPDIFLYTDQQCSMCHEGSQDLLSIRLKCGHIHHVKCLKQWVSKNSTCPLCRESV